MICVDGFTYERNAIETWFSEQATKFNATGVYKSPVTGLPLQSSLLIPNINLSKAVAMFGSRNGQFSPSAPPPTAPSKSDSIDSLQFSPWSLGRAVTLDDHRSAAVKSIQHADTVDWYELVAFSAFPARFTAGETPRSVFLIEKAKTGWGGITLGFSPLAPERIKTAELEDFLDANAWWLDGSSWFHKPNGASVLVPWSTSKLREGDRVGICVPTHGRFCVYVNGKKTVDLKDTDLPVKVGAQLYGFVGLGGGFDRIRIVQDTPADWSGDIK